MPELLIGISPQPNFPHEDLSQDNADLLELMMANHELLRASHDAVEQTSWIFRVGHTSIVYSASSLYDANDRLKAIDHGVTSFEAITALVGGIAVVSDMHPTNKEASRLARMNVPEISDYADEALEDLHTQVPRTAEVVRASSVRFHGPLTTYALLGAAMSRKFELSVA